MCSAADPGRLSENEAACHFTFGGGSAAGAAEFLRSFAGREVLLLSSTRTAADELLRSICAQSGSAFGVHRFTVPQLAIEVATPRLVQSAQTVLGGVAVGALAARAVYTCKKQNELTWFEPVSHTPGFFRALASTITELRSNGVDLEQLKKSGPAGRGLANLLRQYRLDLEDSKLADLAAIFEAAKAAVQSGAGAFSARPVLFLDVVPMFALEREFLSALAGQATEVMATAHSRDEDSVRILSRLLAVEPTAPHREAWRICVLNLHPGCAPSP